MTIKSKYLVLIHSLLLSFFATNVFAPPINIDSCGRSWTLTSPSAALAFGEFSIDSGSGTISMSNTGALTTVGDIGLTTTLPVTTYQIQADNRLGTACLAYPFTLAWNTAPTPLAPVGGVGTNLNLTVFVYEPTIATSANISFPINVPANSALTLPFTLTLYGNIATTYPQTADDYLSPTFRVELIQGTATKLSPNATATATSIVPLAISELTPMNFGTVAGGSLSGTVILDVLGTRTTTGDGSILAAGPGNSGAFQLSGQPGLTYTLLITGPAVLENATGQQINATTFVNNSLGIIPAAGVETFQVGATLNLGPLQTSGTYSTATGAGSPYTVTVNYN